MATDLIADGDPIPLAEAARMLPGQPNPSTLFRWRTRGIRGTKLETLMIGGRRFVRPAALNRFIDAINSPNEPPEDGATTTASTGGPQNPPGGKRSSETARRLKEAGLV